MRRTVFAGALLCAAFASHAADYTRDGGTADEMCCADKACTQIVSQRADRVRAVKDCEALTDKDGVTRYVRSQAFRITKPGTPPPPPPPPTNRAPTISGTPLAAVVVGQAYSFTPSGADPDGDALTYSIAGKPVWAAFSTATGALTGTPAAANVGISSSIVITVSDGKASAATTAFSITVTAPPPPSLTALVYSATAGGTYAALAGATVSGGINVRLSISCDPNLPPQSWAFSIDGVARNSESQCPFALIDDNALLDTKTLTNGSHAVRAVGSSTVSASFTVANAAPPPPPPPSPPGTGSATLSWTPPTQNTDGSAIANLAGYRIQYGTSPSAMTQTIAVSNPGLSSYIVNGLTPGTWHFALRSYNSTGGESAASNVASKVIAQ